MEVVVHAILWMEAATAEASLARAARRLAVVVEQKYRPDQPRVPAGVPEGGQWTDADGASVTRVAARVTFSGYLVGRELYPSSNRFYCLYYDSREDYTFAVPAIDGYFCPPARLHY